MWKSIIEGIFEYFAKKAKAQGGLKKTENL